MAELTAGELGQLLAALDAIGDELGAISTWLAKLDHDEASIMLQDGWRSVASAGWILERPLREAQRRQHAEGRSAAG
jgi:hypothetical protein